MSVRMHLHDVTRIEISSPELVPKTSSYTATLRIHSSETKHPMTLYLYTTDPTNLIAVEAAKL